MPTEWPPHDYQPPKEYESNEILLWVTTLTLGIVFGLAAAPSIIRGVAAYRTAIIGSLEAVAVTHPPVISALSVIIATIGLVTIFIRGVVPIHEAIHYYAGVIVDVNPEFGYTEGYIFKNPRVVPLATGIPAWKNLILLFAPFGLIGITSYAIMVSTSGIAAGIAGVILWANSTASGHDIANYLRILRMPPNTLFANFKEGDTIRTEYALPE